MSKVIVIYGGGFQPFHAGHLSSYIEAKEAFPKADFYVAASNDTKTRPIPFKDKKFLAQQAGVASPFVEVKLPIRPLEILDKYNPETDIFILVRSERDPVAYTKKDGTPGYYQPFISLDECNPFESNGYIFVTKKHDFILKGHEVYSGTQVRDMYADSDDSGRTEMIDQMYPKSKQKNTIKKMLDKYIGSSEPIVEPDKSAIKQLKAKKLKEQIQRMRPLLKEANIKQKYKFLKLMKESMRQLSDVSSKEYLDGAQRAKLLIKLLGTGEYELSDLELLSSNELVDLYRQEFTQELDEINFFHINNPTTPAKSTTPTKSTTPAEVDDYHAYFGEPQLKKEKVYHGPGEFYDKTKVDPFKEPVKEFASGGDFQPPKPPKPPKNKNNGPWDNDDDDDDDDDGPRGPNIIGKQMLKLQQQKKRIIWRPWLNDGNPEIIAIIKNIRPSINGRDIVDFIYSWKTSGGKWIKRESSVGPGSEKNYSLVPYNDFTYELKDIEEPPEVHQNNTESIDYLEEK